MCRRDGYVYVVATVNTFAKIGRTCDPARRFREYRTIAGPHFRVLAIAHVRDMVAAERALHETFAPFRVPNTRELYDAPHAVIASAVEALNAL